MKSKEFLASWGTKTALRPFQRRLPETGWRLCRSDHFLEELILGKGIGPCLNHGQAFLRRGTTDSVMNRNIEKESQEKDLSFSDLSSNLCRAFAFLLGLQGEGLVFEVLFFLLLFLLEADG